MSKLTELTAQIVSAYVSGNAVETEALPDLIRTVHDQLARADQPGQEPKPTPTPAVPIKKSVFPGYIICLEDGKQMTMLKRYLWTKFNMTPRDYRAKWDLPSDYPMVAPNYAAKRSTLAKAIGLGRKPSDVAPDGEGSDVEPKVTQVPARRARGNKG